MKWYFWQNIYEPQPIFLSSFGEDKFAVMNKVILLIYNVKASSNDSVAEMTRHNHHSEQHICEND